MKSVVGYGPELSPTLVSRVLAGLELANAPPPDLAGLNRICAAFAVKVPNDNIQKRIWLAGDRLRPVTGGDPIEFFELWLTHGTGGTCFPANGALYALLRAIGFDVRRLSGDVLVPGMEVGGNHGTLLVSLGGADYLVDAQLKAFQALPLVPGQTTSTGDGIHAIRAVPVDGGFHVQWYASNRRQPMVMRPDLAMDVVDHGYFLAQYALSTSHDRKRSPFNEALSIIRHFPNSILAVNRTTRIDVTADNSATRTEITLAERARILVEELGISSAMVDALPPDEVH